MVDTVSMLMYALVFVTGFITGKLFAALQFAGMKSGAKIPNSNYPAKRSVDRLMQLGKKL